MFKILSLDGGGIRGAFVAAYLSELEGELRARGGGALHEHFDLIAGTSTGGIIALAVALGIPASRLVKLYQHAGQAIFTERDPRQTKFQVNVWGMPLSVPVSKIEQGLLAGKIKLSQVLRSKYDGAALHAELDAIFGSKRLGEAATRLIVTSADLTSGKTAVFRTPHLDPHDSDAQILARDAARATTAAPTFFPHSPVPPKGALEPTAYADGGLWANNPAMVAFAEALRCGAKPEEIYMLSIGTGAAQYRLQPPGAGDDGLAWWGPRLLDIVGITQAQGIDFLSRSVLGERYCRIQFEMGDKPWGLDDMDKLPHLVAAAVVNWQETRGAIEATFLANKVVQRRAS